MDHQQDAVWSSALWTQHRSRARFPWLHFRTGIKAISNWCLVSFCSIAAILAKTLGTVMQYSWFSVISGCPYKTVQPLKNFLQFSLAKTYTKLKLKTILDTHVHPCLWGGGEVGHVWFEESLSYANGMSTTFVHDWKYERHNLKIACLIEILPYLKMWGWMIEWMEVYLISGLMRLVRALAIIKYANKPRENKLIKLLISKRERNTYLQYKDKIIQ